MLLELDEPLLEEVISENELKLSFSPAHNGTVKSMNVSIEGKFTYKNLDIFNEKMNYYLLRYKVFYITLKTIDRIDAAAVDFLTDLIKRERYRTIVIEGALSPNEKAMFYRFCVTETPLMN